ncbi:hypothetical protein PYK79_13360 [Streptomyces sp. ID05-04B]|uniref:hypothetical protein n=1 Tax=Streptomyces sp. ID05-04B TaxID=3028661 RepID=UPI0029C4100D|nr:hypothetical protein [Streptomyces sp. ID05-04B]MDX5564134.1 hypothetical protein [Streptomyces sp. ID05-04B]
MKYALVNGNVAWSQGTTQLTRGKSADDDHPLVLERPDLFSDEVPDAELSSAPVVERATAAPGEKRTVSRKPTAGKPASGKPAGGKGDDGAKGGSGE